MTLNIPWYLWVLIYTGVACSITSVFTSRASMKAWRERNIERSDQLDKLTLLLSCFGWALATGLGLVCMAIFSR
nr:MAG TPA: hypothetical protein [Caudoviricetes sp.]